MIAINYNNKQCTCSWNASYMFSMNSRDFSGETNVANNCKITIFTVLFRLCLFVCNIFAFKTLVKALHKRP